MTDVDRLAGAVLGAAVGDAIGHPVEFDSLAAIRATHGPRGVEGYALWWERDGARFAPYTDDTQMAEIVLRARAHARATRAGATVRTRRHKTTNAPLAWATRGASEGRETANDYRHEHYSRLSGAGQGR